MDFNICKTHLVSDISNHYKPPFEADDGHFSLDVPISTTLSEAPLSAIQPLTVPALPLNTKLPAPKLTLVLPAFFPCKTQTGDHILQPLQPESHTSLHAFFTHDLSVVRLNIIHKHLWLAGLPVSARALHHQVLLGRSIVVTEHTDLHLVWHDDIMYFKPLPPYLLCHEIWVEVICKDRELYEQASGLLLSYLWLIGTPADLHLAQTGLLLPPTITWPRWTLLSRNLLNTLDHGTLHDISPRYRYGELRLPRLNMIYRLCSATRNPSTFIRGYHYGYRQYSAFIVRNFAWLLTPIIYITVVLTAMQVGLGTDALNGNRVFERVAVGFTVFSILAPLCVLLAIGMVSAALVVFNVDFALRAQERKREILGREAAFGH